MDKIKDIIRLFYAVMSVVTPPCAIYQATNEKSSSAIILGGLFLASALLFYLPQLETLKAFGVEARLIRSLDRAEEIIEKLKGISAANARVTYLTAAWANRLGGPTALEKQKVLDQLNAELKVVGLDDNDLYEVAKPHLQFIAYDYAWVYQKKIHGRLLELAKQRDGDEGFQTAIANYAIKRIPRDDSILNIESTLIALTPSELLGKEDLSKAIAFRTKLTKLVNDSVEGLGFTKAAADYLAKNACDVEGKLGNDVFHPSSDTK